MIEFLSKAYFDLLSDQQPELIGLIRQLLDIGQTPQQICDRIEEICPSNSVMPGLVLGAAKYMMSN